MSKKQQKKPKNITHISIDHATDYRGPLGRILHYDIVERSGFIGIEMDIAVFKERVEDFRKLFKLDKMGEKRDNKKMKETEIQFQGWKDRGGNIGIECLLCQRTHWTEDAPATNPVTGLSCDNCAVIKNTGLLQFENEQHVKEIKEHRDCFHKPSQPEL